MNTPNKIWEIHLDTSVISAEQTNGGTYRSIKPSSSKNRYTFIVPIRKNIVPGVYCISCHLIVGNGIVVSRDIAIEIKANKHRPKIHIPSEIKPISQENIFYSGAAAMQMLQAYYKQPITSQKNIREMIEYSKKISDYEAFNVWRIILRRIISSNAQSTSYLPEHQRHSA